MALVNPNIAMSFRMPEFTPRNALAEFAQMQQIQGGQQAQELARFQLGAAQRAESVQNALTDAYASSIDPTGNIDYNKLVGSLAKGGGASQIPGVLRTKAETKSAQLKQQETEGKIAQNQFDLQDKKLKFAWNAVGSSATPEAAIAELTKGASQGVFGMQAATSEIQQLRSMNPDQFRQYRIQKISDILDAKDKLGFMLPKVERQDIGGQFINIQGNPMLPDYGKRIPGMDISKTPTIGETTAQGQLDVSQGQLRVAQGNARLAQDRFAFEQANPGFDLKEDSDGNFFAINKRTNVATPVMVGGAAPAAAVAPAAPGAGMPGPRVPAPAAVAPGQQLQGKTGALTESQGNATAYGMRMKEANTILESLEKAGKTNTGLIKNVVGGTVGLIPLFGEKLEDASGSIFNALPRVLGGLSPEQQQVLQARINFITAILRKESGAAIGPNEFATAEKNYFPKPGDDDVAIAQKQQARRTAIRAMEIQAGPGAKQMGGAGAIPGASSTNPLGLPGL